MLKQCIRYSWVFALGGVAMTASTIPGQTPVVTEAPAGWFGVTLSDEGLFDESGNTFFQGYPIVSAVEPNSPAAKAGVQPGDVLVSFNSRDMRGGVLHLRDWLKPGAPFVLQLRRNDAMRVVRGTLGRPPEGWEKRVVINLRPSQVFEQRTRTPARQPLPSGNRAQTVMIRTPMPSRVPSALIPSFTFGSGVYPFAGMEFTALNEDIRELLGVQPDGVFVTNVVEGTPARIAGLRGGDVLLFADGSKLETPIDLVNAIAKAQDRTLALRIMRKQKAQSLTLRW